MTQVLFEQFRRLDKSKSIPQVRFQSGSQLVKYTHTSMFPQRATFYLEDDDRTYLMDSYSELLYRAERTRATCDLGYVEIIEDTCPLLIDVDLEGPCNEHGEPVHLYTPEDVHQALFVVMMQLKKILPENIPYDPTLFCALLEKPPYITEHGTCKNGFHLHFPFLLMTKNDIRNHVYPHLARAVDQVFERKVFDQCIVNGNRGWLLYGSKKSANMEPYMLSRFYDDSLSEISLCNALANFFPFRKPDGTMIVCEKPAEFYLPYVFSMASRSRPTVVIPVQVMESVLVREITRADADNELAPPAPDALQKATELVKMLSATRASHYDQWSMVGYSIYNMCGPSRESLNLWIEFSSKSERNNFSEQGCVYKWSQMKRHNYNKLYAFAREDSPTAYADFRARYEPQDRLKNTLLAESSHADVAQVVYDEFKDMFVCSSIHPVRWYEFAEHTWSNVKTGHSLRRRLSTFIVEKYKFLLRRLNIELGQRGDDAGDVLRAQIKACVSMIKNLKTRGYKDNIMIECAEIFHDPLFEKKLDQNPFLIAFANGVYDLRAHVFRNGEPADCMGRAMPIDYVADYNTMSPEVLEVEDFFERIFPDREVRTFFKREYSKIFVGGNFDKRLFIWVGDGNNGKSIMSLFLERMLGKYMQKPPSSLITKDRAKSGAADPFMSRLVGSRMIMFQEVRPEDPLHCGTIKELTGNDRFAVRDLFEKGADVEEIVPMFKTSLMCNELPTMVNADQAMWNRVRIIPFESNFVDEKEAPSSHAECVRTKTFPMDRTFSEDRLPRMLCAFAWMLLQEFKSTGGRWIGEEPLAVRVATKEYRNENSILDNFINTRLTVVDDKRTKRPYIKDERLWNMYTQFMLSLGYTQHQCTKPLIFHRKLRVLERRGCKRGKERWYNLEETPLDGEDDEESEVRGPVEESVEMREPELSEDHSEHRSPLKKRRIADEDTYDVIS